MKSREFFSLNGELEEGVDQGIQKGNPEYKELHESSPEFEGYLGDVDFESLKSSFISLLKKTDVAPESINMVFADDIIFSSRDLEDGGTYMMMQNMITLNPEVIEAYGKDNGVSEKLFFLETLIHEEVHAVSKFNCQGFLEYDNGEEFGMLFRQAGYGLETFERTNDEERRDRAFALFDEGVTELLAREVTRDYLKSHPEFENGNEIKRYFDPANNRPYQIPVFFVEALIEKIVHETGVSRDTVWGAIIRGKLEGENLANEDFRELAAEVLGKSMLEGLFKVNEEYNQMVMVGLMESMDINEINPELWKRVQQHVDTVKRAQQKQYQAELDNENRDASNEAA
ncbi:MAG: hypothetical protein KW788_01215 [Candidatus Doudnabacteria bacterium]|nr:hypothetical protein [Candidatus Doudnabacteria bacterium]